jgi:hypothetical protein
MINTLDIAWLAGLWEGEGCFSLNRERPRMTINMKDKDIIERAHSLMKVKTNIATNDYRKNSMCNITYSFSLNGRDAIEWMMTFYTFFGSRRQNKIKSIISLWKEHRLHFQSKSTKNLHGQEILKRKTAGEDVKDIAKIYNITPSHAYQIIRQLTT